MINHSSHRDVIPRRKRAFALTQPIGDLHGPNRKTEIETRNKALVQAGFDAWNAGTGNPFELLADDASWTIVGNSDASKTYSNRGMPSCRR